MSGTFAEAHWTPTLAAFRAYAGLSGDDNPIHLDPDFAAIHPFGRVVSHGMLIHARLCALAKSQDLAPARVAKMTFPAPAYAGEPLRLWLQSAPDGLAARAARGDGTLVYDALWRLVAPAQTAMETPPRPVMRIAERARLIRSFTAQDLAVFEALSGARAMGPPEGRMGQQEEGSTVSEPCRAAPPSSDPVGDPAVSAQDRVPDALLGGLFSCLLGTRLPGPGTGWLKQELHHFAAARVGEPLTAEVEVIRLRPEKNLVDLMCICTGNDGRLLCRGRALMLLSAGAALQS